jgi:flagellar hook assembly protein FlgD
MDVDQSGNLWIGVNGGGVAVYNEGGIVKVQEEISKIKIENFRLFQNYPNPFNPATTIKYQLRNASDVQISIYEISGNLVKTLVNDYKTSGYYQVIWDASDLSSGVYFYKINAGSFYDVKKCILIK